jgi:hypothetical protein
MSTQTSIYIGEHKHDGSFSHKDFSINNAHYVFTLRLILHSGNYGFCLFQIKTSNEEHRWQYWRVDGHDNELPYMLIIPIHRSGETALRGLSIANLELLAKAFEMVVAASHKHGASDLHIWQLVSALCHLKVSTLLALQTQS